ncbi:MAG: Isopentenyldiphosphate isomerase [uncultured bacterium]|nr:MAG: Isopentenyldiphosphate isomerase [uncultured bacterium]
MSEEYLDIVDENGNLTGEKELRSVCHEKGLRHQTVHIYFFRKVQDDFELLVHLRSKDKSSHPNRWDTRFGGHVETGQMMDEAAEREIKEETGLDLKIKDMTIGFFGTYQSKDGGNKEVTQTYYYNFNDDLDTLSFNDGEVQDVKWMSFDEIERSMSASPDIWSGSVNGLNTTKEDLLQKTK